VIQRIGSMIVVGTGCKPTPLLACLTVVCALLLGVPPSVGSAETACSGMSSVPVRFRGQLALGGIPDPANVSPNGYLYAACLYRANRVIVMRPTTFGELDYGSVRVAGDFLAYVIKEDDFPFSRNKVESVNLVTGRYVHEVTAHPSALAVNPKLRPTGSVAWVEENARSFTLRLADRRGVRTPQHGHRIHEWSLRLRGSTLRWRQGHRTYSTRLV